MLNGDSPDALLEAVIDTVLVDAYGEDEQLTAWETVLKDTITVPVEATVVGQPVTVSGIGVPGGRPELAARCRTARGDSGVTAVADLVFPPESEAAWLHAAYRRFLGLDPFPAVPRPHWTWLPD